MIDKNMDKDLLKIIEFYGAMPQLKYLQSEVFELDEAIINHELKESVEYEIPLSEIIGAKEHIAEEIADCLVMLMQFKEYYHIDGKQIMKIMKQKIDRQLDRIEKEKNK